jgi:hypothetical protein
VIRTVGWQDRTVAVDTAVLVQRLLDELCVRLGLCLSPADQKRLREAPRLEMNAFTDGVLVAEGLDPKLHKDLRRQVVAIVERRMAVDRGHEV